MTHPLIEKVEAAITDLGPFTPLGEAWAEQCRLMALRIVENEDPEAWAWNTLPNLLGNLKIHHVEDGHSRPGQYA